MRNLHPDFDGFGTSAMKQAVDTKILKGRPYGGTGFLYNKQFASCLRVTVLRLETVPFDILLINVYFPYYNTRDIQTYMSLYHETIGFVENIIVQNPECKIMILADFNCNLNNNSHPYTSLIREFMRCNNLVSNHNITMDFDYDTGLSRFDMKTKSFTLINVISNKFCDIASGV